MIEMSDGGWTPETLKQYLDAKLAAAEHATAIALDAVRDARTNSQTMINIAITLAVAASGSVLAVILYLLTKK